MTTDRAHLYIVTTKKSGTMSALKNYSADELELSVSLLSPPLMKIALQTELKSSSLRETSFFTTSDIANFL